MANTLKFGSGQWATKVGSTLAYNDEGGNFKPLPFNFTRSTGGTRVNKDGLIEMVTNNKPRIDYLNDSNGVLLLEPQRTNLLLRSEEFDNASWVKLGQGTGSVPIVTPNYAISPDGTQNASRLQCDLNGGNTTSDRSWLYQSITDVVVESTFSLYVKNISSETIIFTLNNGSSGTVSVPADSQWHRLYSVKTGGAQPRIGLIGGVGASDNADLLIWGSQIEVGSYATSYIPTQGAIAGVTRVAEVCSQENLLTDIINASYPFTMYVDGKYNGQLSPLLSFLNIDASQQFFLIYIFDDEVLFSARSNGTIEIIESNINLVDGQEFKIAVTMENSTSGKICVNGNSVTVKNNFSSQIQNSNITDLLIGQERVVSDGGVRSSVSGVKLYNEALTDQELINLTTI